MFCRKARQRNQRDSDDLWRLWYLGVQSMTLSVSVLGSDDPDNPENNVNGGTASSSNGSDKDDKEVLRKKPSVSRPPAISLQLAPEVDQTRVCDADDDFRKSEENVNLLRADNLSKNNEPSKSEQDLVLGASCYSDALLSASPTNGSVTPSTPTMTMLMSDELDSEAVARAMKDWADAPVQDVEESQL